MNGRDSEEAMEAMFGNEEWQFERIISDSDMDRKNDIVFLVDEVDIYILPCLKKKDARDLKDGEAIDFLVYDEDTKESFRLKLNFEPPVYHLRDTSELYDKKGLASGQRIGFRYEGHFAMLVVKILD